jgi:hypothetical protein
MKTTFLFLIAIVVVSCTGSDSETPSDNFFRLETGNLWVYKRFHSSDNITYTATTRIDSVTITGDTIIGGLTYAKLHHRVTPSDSFDGMEDYFREDANGHLVNPAGYVIHPGNDAAYTGSREIVAGETPIGNVNYHLDTPGNVSVEGQDYFVYPYIGNFVPTDGVSPPNVIYDQYQEDLGLVCQHCAAVSGTFYYEDRLISYDLN